MERKVAINGANHTLHIAEFDEDIDIDALLRIDMTNLIGEIVNFPVIVNRFGIMVARAAREVSEAKMSLEIQEAKLKQELFDSHEAQGLKAPTVDGARNYVIQHKVYRAFKKLLMDKQETHDMLQSVMWSAKDKSDKLNKLSLTIADGDVEDALRERGRQGLIRDHKKK